MSYFEKRSNATFVKKMEYLREKSNTAFHFFKSRKIQ